MNNQRLQEIKDNFNSLHPDDRTEDMADLLAEVERLLAVASIVLLTWDTPGKIGIVEAMDELSAVVSGLDG